MRQILTTSCLILLPLLSLGTDWERLPPLPEPNGGFACAVAGGRVLVIGGTRWQDGRKLWLSQVHAYDIQGGRWSAASPLPHPVAYGLAGAAQKGAVWLVCGHDGGAAHSGSWQVDSGESRQLPMPTGLPARCLAGGGLVNGKMVVVGGCTDPGKMDDASTEVFLADEQGRVVAAAPRPGPPVLIPASVVVGGRLFLFGGAVWQEGKVGNTAATAVFDIGSGEWKNLRTLPAAVRGLSGVLLPDGRIYLAGGYLEGTQDFTDSAWFYDVEKDAFSPAPPLPYRAMAGLACDGAHVYCIGGEDRKQSRTDAFYRIAARALSRR